jgi:hypothetical protein
MMMDSFVLEVDDVCCVSITIIIIVTDYMQEIYPLPYKICREGSKYRHINIAYESREALLSLSLELLLYI